MEEELNTLARINLEEENKTPEGKKNYWHKFHIVMDIILIAIAVYAVWYCSNVIIPEFEAFKILNSDVCEYCMEKTGAICSKVSFLR